MVGVSTAAYWLAPAQNGAGASAFLQPVELAEKTSADQGDVRDVHIALSHLTVDETMVAAGGRAHLCVKLDTPDNQQLPIRIFARESQTGSVGELSRISADGWFTGDIAIPRNAPSSADVVSVAALPTSPVDCPAAVANLPDPVKGLAARLSDLRPESAYVFDPRVVAAKNRLETVVTVLGAKQEVAAIAPALLPAANVDLVASVSSPPATPVPLP